MNNINTLVTQDQKRASIFWPTTQETQRMLFQLSEHKRATDMYKKYDKYYTCLCSECRKVQ